MPEEDPKLVPGPWFLSAAISVSSEKEFEKQQS